MTYYCSCRGRKGIYFQLRHNEAHDVVNSIDGVVFRFQCYATASVAERILNHYERVEANVCGIAKEGIRTEGTVTMHGNASDRGSASTEMKVQYSEKETIDGAFNMIRLRQLKE
jgi:hypothetical protein